MFPAAPGIDTFGGGPGDSVGEGYDYTGEDTGLYSSTIDSN